MIRLIQLINVQCILFQLFWTAVYLFISKINRRVKSFFQITENTELEFFETSARTGEGVTGVRN